MNFTRGRRYTNCGWLVLSGSFWIVVALALPADAQDLSATAPAPLRTLLQPSRCTYTPDVPVWLRFTLLNPADEAATIPLEQGDTGDAISLPLELIVGAGERRALSITYESDPPKDVPIPALPGAPTTGKTLRLAPHAVLGAEIDLRKYFPGARYCGAYKVEWRPFGSGSPAATAEFRVEPRKDAILITDLPGKITFILDYENAPQNVENFLDLVRQGFYAGKSFHRVIPGFLIQGGCSKGDGTGVRSDGKLVPAEFRSTPIDVGTLVMARKPSDPNSASCQFCIALARLPELDGQYTVIGQAQDPESIRMLQQLAEVATDKRDRPVSPVVIRSINLADAEPGRPRELEARTQREPAP